MIYSNKKNLDLQKIALLMNENNVDCSLKGNKLIISSNSIEFHLACNKKEIVIIHSTPAWFYLIFFIFSTLIFGVILYHSGINSQRKLSEWLEGPGFFILGLCAAIDKFVPPFLFRYHSSVLRGKKQIMSIILNSTPISDEVHQAKNDGL